MAAKLKANKEERHTHHEKRALQKANQQAGIESSSEDVFERRTNPTVCLLFPFKFSLNYYIREVATKVTLGMRTAKVPPACTAASSFQSVSFYFFKDTFSKE